MLRRRLWFVGPFVGLIWLLVGCRAGGSYAALPTAIATTVVAPTAVAAIATPTPVATVTLVAPTTPAATETAVPTATAIASATPPQPSATPPPANTPLPTWTTLATNTPQGSAPPSSTPAPRASALPSATPPAAAASAVMPTTPPTPLPTAVPSTPTPAPTPTAALTLADLAALPDGATVTLTASVVASASFAQGFKFTLADESGRAVLLMWHNVYDDCWDRAVLNVGARVLVSGEVQRFNGELQIEPQWGGGVQVLTPAYPWAAAWRIGELAQAVDQRVMIDGTIASVSVTADWTKLIVADDSGQVEVHIWANVWQRVAQRDALGAGVPVRVVGLVTRFRDTLQVAPALPVDLVRR